ncbi:hypothetical protein [Aquimarina pacifica]|uniref:hypothetical protein n=1 Tax=Aquimarina pacifica TaxID=1296415 RepID=UPI000471571D|nr:hypothetical protein [Aquimarina pacifica]
MPEENDSQRKSWDLMIGITLVVFGGLRLYNQFKTNIDWDFRAMFTLLFIGYGGYLVYRHFQNSKKD